MHNERVMDAVYLVCLLVGGFFVLLSILGGGDTDADVDADVEADFDADLDAADAEAEGASSDLEALEAVSDDAPSAGPGLVDLFTLRALFLFMAFFGLTGVLLGWTGTVEPLRFLVSFGLGAAIGLGGNYVIQRIGYQTVSSTVRERDLQGATATVQLPFSGDTLGKIDLQARGHRLQMRARAFEGADGEFARGDDVVIVRMKEGVAEVVKPD